MQVGSLKNLVKWGFVFLAGFLLIEVNGSVAFGAKAEKRDSNYTSIAKHHCIVTPSNNDEDLIETWACPGLLDENGRGYHVHISRFQDGDQLNLESPDSPRIELNTKGVFDFAQITGSKIEWRGNVKSDGGVFHDSLIVRISSRTNEERLLVFKINAFRACLLAAVPAHDPRGANQLARLVSDLVARETDCSPDFH